MNTETDNPSTFKSIFFSEQATVSIRVPDYQRAYSWEQKEIELFIGDLRKYHGKGDYYFGHFIVEEDNGSWEIVDGQQRITTFVLFLMVCRVLSPSTDRIFGYSFLERFKTVSYDINNLETISVGLRAFLAANQHLDGQKEPEDDQIIKQLNLSECFTRSQRRMVLALLLFNKAFQKGELELEKVTGYIDAVLASCCSVHRTKNKSVAVNIFEMHNTRGVPLSTAEIIKAKLMKHVYDHGGHDREKKVRQIQKEFGEIYGMEERLAQRCFRGEMTMDQLMRLHLRVVDDGNKKTVEQLQHPLTNANVDNLVMYIDSRLRGMDGQTGTPKEPHDGVQYALNLAKELNKSMRIVSEILPKLDEDEELVGDVLILERELSCQFFLIVCRRLERKQDKATGGTVGRDTLALWEKLLFTRDFHERYRNLNRGYRDNFPALFASCWAADNEKQISDVIDSYLANGFRPERTPGLQAIVFDYLNNHKESILTDAFWSRWNDKLKYAIYKYERDRDVPLRAVMKDGISVEHTLPQEWQWEWLDDCRQGHNLSPEEQDNHSRRIGSFINGLGNLLILTSGENTSQSNCHPVEKYYSFKGGSYDDHNRDRERWNSSAEWPKLIRERGERIFNFMLKTLVGAPASGSSPSPVTL